MGKFHLKCWQTKSAPFYCLSATSWPYSYLFPHHLPVFPGLSLPGAKVFAHLPDPDHHFVACQGCLLRPVLALGGVSRLKAAWDCSLPTPTLPAHLLDVWPRNCGRSEGITGVMTWGSLPSPPSTFFLPRAEPIRLGPLSPRRLLWLHNSSTRPRRGAHPFSTFPHNLFLSSPFGPPPKHSQEEKPMPLTWDFKHPHSFSSANSTDKLRQGGRGFGGEESLLRSRPKGEKFARRLNSHLRNQEFGTSLAAAAGRAARVQSLGFQLASDSAASPPPVKSPPRWDGSRATQPTRLNTSHRGRRTCQCRKQPLHFQGSPLRLRLRAGREGVGRGHPGPGVGDGVDPLRSIPSRSQIRAFPAPAKSRLPRDAPFQQECVLQ